MSLFTGMKNIPFKLLIQVSLAKVEQLELLTLIGSLYISTEHTFHLHVTCNIYKNNLNLQNSYQAELTKTKKEF